MHARPNHPARLRVAHRKRSRSEASESALKPCAVYMLAIKRGHSLTGPCKIGVASNPEARRRELQTGCPWPIVPLMAIRLPTRINARRLEFYLLASLSNESMQGEWIDLDPISLLRRVQYLINDSVVDDADGKFEALCELWGCGSDDFEAAIKCVSLESWEALYA